MTSPEHAEDIADAPDLEVDPGPIETPEVADEARRLIAKSDADGSDDDEWRLYGDDD